MRSLFGGPFFIPLQRLTVSLVLSNETRNVPTKITFMWNTHLSYIIRKKRIGSSAQINPIGHVALPDLSTKTAIGRTKKTCQPPHFPFFGCLSMALTATKQTAAYWPFVLSFKMTADRRDSYWFSGLSVTPVQARVCASAPREGGGSSTQSFYLFLCFQEKKNNHSGIFLCGTANVSRPNKREPWTILQYVLKSPI